MDFCGRCQYGGRDYLFYPENAVLGSIYRRHGTVTHRNVLSGSNAAVFIGLLGEYVLSINTRVLDRPLVVEEERLNFEEKEDSENESKTGKA